MGSGSNEARFVGPVPTYKLVDYILHELALFSDNTDEGYLVAYARLRTL